MAYVWKHPNPAKPEPRGERNAATGRVEIIVENMFVVWQRDTKSPFWTGVYRDDQNQWRKKSTKKTVKTTALALAIEWERAAQLGRDKILTEAVSREVIGGILERTTGEKLRQSTVREFCDEWLRGKTNSRQQRTAERYAMSVHRFNEFLGAKADRPISAIAPPDCQKYYDKLAGQKFALASLRVEMKTISSVFNFARRLGLIATNPVSAVDLPERIKQVKRKVFTPAQVQMLIDAADAEWKIACSEFSHAAARWPGGEALPLYGRGHFL